MKLIIGTQLGCAKNLTPTKTGGVRFAAVAELYNPNGENTTVWISCFASGYPMNKLQQLVEKNGGRLPPGINVSGELVEMGIYNGQPQMAINVLSVEPSYGFGGSTVTLIATNVGLGKDLWKSSKSQFSRTSGAISFWDAQAKQEFACWVDLKFFGSTSQLAAKLKLGKGAVVNIVGELSEAAVATDKGRQFLNVSFDVSSLKRINKHTKEYDAAQKEESGYEMPRNYFSGSGEPEGAGMEMPMVSEPSFYMFDDDQPQTVHYSSAPSAPRQPEPEPQYAVPEGVKVEQTSPPEKPKTYGVDDVDEFLRATMGDLF